VYEAAKQEREAEVYEAAKQEPLSAWAEMCDVRIALELTDWDKKERHIAARKLLELGLDWLSQAREAMAELRDWKLHWSQSREGIFYFEKRNPTDLKLDACECPFGWAFDVRSEQYCFVARPQEQYSSPPSVAREPEFEFDTYLGNLDRTTRDKILGKRDYFFRGIDTQIRERIQMDEEASYSVTEMRLADQTSTMILQTLSRHGMARPSSAAITDATACIGGNTVNFSRHFAHVNAVELDRTRFEMLRNNTQLLCDKNVEVHHGDYTSTELQDTLTQDIVFFDPPRGGVDYRNRTRPVELFLSGQTLADVCRGLRGRAKFVVLKLPFNFAFQDFLRACAQGGALEEVERREMGRLPNKPPKFVIMILKVATPGRVVSAPSCGFQARAATCSGRKRDLDEAGANDGQAGAGEYHTLNKPRLQHRAGEFERHLPSAIKFDTDLLLSTPDSSDSFFIQAPFAMQEAEKVQRQSAQGNRLLMGVELPSPSYGYPTLDLLGSLTCASGIKVSPTPAAIAKQLRNRIQLEAGLLLDDELLLPPLELLALEGGTKRNVPAKLPSKIDSAAVRESSHFQVRVAQSDRPDREESLTAAATGEVLKEESLASSDKTRYLKSQVFATEVEGPQLPRAVRVVYDEWTDESGLRQREMITTFSKVRMQVVVIAPSSVAARILEHRDTLKPTLRSKYARSRGSGVSDLAALTDTDIEACPAFSMASGKDVARWAGLHVADETKEYSQSETGIKCCGINPDFQKYYLQTHRDALLDALRGSASAEQQQLPSLYVAKGLGVGKMPVVFVTIHLPNTVDLRLLPSAIGTGLQILSVATAEDRHPKPDLGPWGRTMTSEPPAPEGPPSIETEMERLALAEDRAQHAHTADSEQENGGRRLQCQDCASAFIFSAKDQAHFARNRWPDPKRCKGCRTAKKGRSRG